MADGGDGDDELTSAGYFGASVLRGGPGDDQLAAGVGGLASATRSTAGQGTTGSSGD